MSFLACSVDAVLKCASICLISANSNLLFDVEILGKRHEDHSGL